MHGFSWPSWAIFSLFRSLAFPLPPLHACWAAVALTALQSPVTQSSAEVMKHGLRAVVNLAAGNDGNQARLGDLGACTGAMRLLLAR